MFFKRVVCLFVFVLFCFFCLFFCSVLFCLFVVECLLNVCCLEEKKQLFLHL